MSEFQFTLEPYSGQKSRHRCPKCNAPEKTFVRYIDRATGGYIHPDVGRCNRENNCGYHYKPRQYFHEHNFPNTPEIAIALKDDIVTMKKPISLISFDALKASLKKHEDNYFVQFLVNLFGTEITCEVVAKYFIGTSKHWEGSTIFWQIDIKGKIRSGKIMLYNPVTGKRVKYPFNHITWVHELLKQEDFVLKQCFFGEHLLQDRSKPVAIVESEKTAIIASVYIPDFIWIAVGGLNNLKAEICELLKGRSVILFPDLNCFDKWNKKAEELSHITKFIVSDFLERNATSDERQKGLDIADYLIRYDYKEFVSPEPEPPPPPFRKDIETFSDEGRIIIIILKNKDISQEHSPGLWDKEITELESGLKQISLPENPIKLNPYSTIINASQFIQSHLDFIKANNGNLTYLPYLKRLQEIKQLLSKSLN
ncbi:MAG: hypothetical protein KA096_01420 [Bacteroidales bacterium]|nr:hypothetical protein [Bacteroidales bacterium]